MTTGLVSFTQGALNELKNLIAEKQLDDSHGLRVGVEGGGCSGMNYILGFDEKKEGDQEFEVEGIRVFLNKAHGLYLAGMEIDFQNGLDNRGFTFSNPNATSTCGCGTSFSV
ncbi:MAG TPA: iron-sulfur cluster assembly accessory protein [Anseongella sp.]